MRIIVFINQVLDPAGMVVNRRAQRLFINRKEYLLNPADLSAVEFALQIKDSADASVIVAALGPDRVTDPIRQAMTMGADRGIHLADELFLQADPAGKATVLAAAAQKCQPFDLILTGDRVWDGDGGQVGPRVAEILDLPLLYSVYAVSWEDGVVRAIQEKAGAYYQVEAVTPALATCPPDVNRPRYGNAARIMNIYRDPTAVERWTTADLDLTAEALAPKTAAGGRGFPEPRELGTLLTGPLNTAVEQLAAALAKPRR